MRRLRGALAALVIGPATALVIVGVAVGLLLNPIWVSLGQDRAEAGVLTGYGPEELRAATGAILADLVFGPPEFDVEVAGEPVLIERERGHMQDVRRVFQALYAVVAVAAAVVLVALLFGRRSPAFWRRVGRGGAGLAVVVLTGGLIGLVFFDAAFEAFHRIFFPAGSYTFDPESERLVQLFPNQFWIETTIALGALLVLLGAFVSSWAGNRAKAIEARVAAASASPRWVRRAPEPAPAAAAAAAGDDATEVLTVPTEPGPPVEVASEAPAAESAPAPGAEPAPESAPAEPTPGPTPGEPGTDPAPSGPDPERDATPRPAS